MESNALIKPPVLDGSNYSIWKIKVRAYIKYTDERAWQAVINGWTPPQWIDEIGDIIPNEESDWTPDEIKTAGYNSKAICILFSSVDSNMFKIINNFVSAKDA